MQEVAKWTRSNFVSEENRLRRSSCDGGTVTKVRTGGRDKNIGVIAVRHCDAVARGRRFAQRLITGWSNRSKREIQPRKQGGANERPHG